MSSSHLSKGSKDPPVQRGKVRLYSMRYCPFAQRVHLVMEAKKIPHDVVYINLTIKPEWMYDKSPNGRIPVLQVDGDTIYESLVICDYLDEKFSYRPLYTKDPWQKAKDRLLIDHFNKVINGLYKILNNPLYFDKEHNENLLVELDAFEKELASRGTKFFDGDKPGMLDYMIWPWCERSDLLHIIGGDNFRLPTGRFRKLMDWRREMIEDEAVKKSYLGPEIHAKYYHSRRAGYPDYDFIISID